MATTLAIMIELDENAPIKVLRQLNELEGIAKMHMNLDAWGKSKRQQQNGALPHSAPRQLAAPTKTENERGQEVLLRYLIQAGKELHLRELALRLHAEGRAAGSVSAFVNSAKKEGWIRGAGKGIWAVTEAGRKHSANLAQVQKVTKESGIKARDVIANALRAFGRPMPGSKLRDAYEEAGFSKKACGSLFKKLIDDGLIKRVITPGQHPSYTLVAK